MSKRKVLRSNPIFKCFSEENNTLEYIQDLPTCVCADMFLEIPRRFEAFVTALLWTFVRLLTGVNSSVRFQSIPCRKRFATPLIITLKWTDSCMWPLMNLSKIKAIHIITDRPGSFIHPPPQKKKTQLIWFILKSLNIISISQNINYFFFQASQSVNMVIH